MIAIEPRFWGACQDLLENYAYMNAAAVAHRPLEPGAPVLGMDSGVDPRRGDRGISGVTTRRRRGEPRRCSPPSSGR